MFHDNANINNCYFEEENRFNKVQNIKGGNDSHRLYIQPGNKDKISNSKLKT